MSGMSQELLRVCSFESRRRDEMARLIERNGGTPTIAPSMREIPLDQNADAFRFADRLLAGEISIVIFMTGVGTNALFDALSTKQLAEAVRESLLGVTVVARGPKPVAALSTLQIPIAYRAPEPNTWHEIVTILKENDVALSGRTVAVQEYGEPSREFYSWLTDQGAEVLPVPVYKWGLPEDVTPLENAIRSACASDFDVLMWTSAQQVNHCCEIADRLNLKDAWIAAANRCMLASIGPTTSERMQQFGLQPDMEPSHPKMAHLVREALEQAPAVLDRKRR